MAIAVVTFCDVAWAFRTLEKDGVKVGWPQGTQLSFELVESYPDLMLSDAVRSEIAQAMQLWNAQIACNAPQLTVSGPTSKIPESGDGKNTIAWVFSNWSAIPSASPDSPGVTDILIGPDENGMYRILEADIYLNAERFKWTTELTAAGLASGQQIQYVKEVVAHELGHALGLDHPCQFDPPAGVPDCMSAGYTSTLMFPAPIYAEPVVASDDATGLCDLYQASTCSNSSSGCSPSQPTVPGDLTSRPLPIAEGGECQSHNDCQSGLVCTQGTCTRVDGTAGDTCETYRECADGMPCVNGACRASCSVVEPCVYNQDCDPATNSCGVDLRVFGARCERADDCTSAQCLLDSTGLSYCTKECGGNGECPNGWQCSEMNRLYVCRQPSPKGDGCMMSLVAPGQGRSASIALILGIGLFGFRIRRQQRMGGN